MQAEGGVVFLGMVERPPSTHRTDREHVRVPELGTCTTAVRVELRCCCFSSFPSHAHSTRSEFLRPFRRYFFFSPTCALPEILRPLRAVGYFHEGELAYDTRRRGAPARASLVVRSRCRSPMHVAEFIVSNTEKGSTKASRAQEQVYKGKSFSALFFPLPPGRYLDMDPLYGSFPAQHDGPIVSCPETQTSSCSANQTQPSPHMHTSPF